MNKLLFSLSFLNRLNTCQRVAVGFSGGLDSFVLLHALANEPTLYPKLMAIHVHHGLSDKADAWQAHCELVCQSLNIPLTVKRMTCLPQEASARAARYKAFDDCLTAEDALILGHHQQDQAETVLLHLCRGAGIDGLGAMRAERQQGVYTVFRPWLDVPREKLVAYAMAHQLTWIEDDSNQDERFSRNHVRHQVIPKLTQRWPKAIEQLAQFAAHARQIQANLNDLALIDCPSLADNKHLLPLESLKQLSLNRFANILWFWLKQQGVRPLTQKRVQRILNELVYAENASGLKQVFSNGVVWHYQSTLYWVTVNTPLCEMPELMLPEGSQVEIRYRKGGERLILNGQTKVLKKCLQAWHVPPWERDSLPLIYVNGELAAVAGYAISDRYKR